MLDREFLRRAEAAEYLRHRYGIPKSAKTLAKDAVLGNDTPPFHRAGRFPLYAVADIDAWAMSRISARSFRSTTEADRPELRDQSDMPASSDRERRS